MFFLLRFFILVSNDSASLDLRSRRAVVRRMTSWIHVWPSMKYIACRQLMKCDRTQERVIFLFFSSIVQNARIIRIQEVKKRWLTVRCIYTTASREDALVYSYRWSDQSCKKKVFSSRFPDENRTRKGEITKGMTYLATHHWMVCIHRKWCYLVKNNQNNVKKRAFRSEMTRMQYCFSIILKVNQWIKSQINYWVADFKVSWYLPRISRLSPVRFGILCEGDPTYWIFPPRS